MSNTRRPLFALHALLCALVPLTVIMFPPQTANAAPTAPTQSEAARKGLTERNREALEELQSRSAASLRGTAAAANKAPFVAASVTSDPRITFNDAKKTPCYYRNQFFNMDIRATAELLHGVASESPPKTGRYGTYEILDAAPGPNTIEVVCDGLVHDFPVTIPDPVENFVEPSLLLSNAPPVISGFKAFVGTQSVVGATKGSIVDLVVTVSDPNRDFLTYVWAVNAGTIISSSGNKAKWQLPNARGVNLAYVVITDGKGAYREASVTVSTDAGTVPAPASTTPTANPSDKVDAGDHFLTFFSTQARLTFAGRGADSKLGSCRYYVSIGAADGCGLNGELINPRFNFSSWKKRWGFDVAGADVQAIYVNGADLNRERNMHGISKALGTAFYVCNHSSANDPTLSNAVNNNKLIACGAMEYSVTPGVNSGLPFVKFYVFGPSGSMIQSANQDGRGEKFLPGACVVCHGAHHGPNLDADFTRFDENGRTQPNLRAQFLPFDLTNFVFSTTASLSRASQEAQFRQLNQLVLKDKPTPAIIEFVKGSYPTATSTFASNFVPAGWAGHEPLYNKVVKPYCRSCHLAMAPDDSTNGLAFQSFEQFRQFNFQNSARTCGLNVGVARKRYSMPNSLVTFNKFWNDAAAVSALQTHLIDEGEILPTDRCVKP